ncbi:hypothetical protein GAYE_SCF00G1835 [Galdieria yellowstonensis]|uniref:Transducin family protein / WD-40 repeat family protein n=1 Tax=Galdieria yellowstonensis TaxID=3028027 RepID=A0AAV9I9D4_9RHOD|nr:hypothetical protein GAYE_SCF00G1835 [Galdieria yellowstonensis]
MEEEQEHKRLKTKNSEFSWKLKKVIRESSGENIRCLLPNRLDSSLYNILCSISKHQVNIYDSTHFGEYLDLFMAFRSAPEEEFLCGAWVKADLESSGALSDTLLAIGTDSGKIHLLSLAYSQEIELISANETGAAVVAMAGSSVHTMTFASLTRDGNVKIWQRRNEQCTLIGNLSFSSTVISFLGDHFILLAGKDNTLRRFDISSVFEGSESNDIPVYLNEDDGQILLKRSNLSKLCHFQVRNEHQVICLFSDGTVIVIDAVHGEQQIKWEVSNFSKDNACKFAISPEGDYFALSNSNGVVSLYDISAGKKVDKFQNERMRKACGNVAFGAKKSQMIISTDCILWFFVSS